MRINHREKWNAKLGFAAVSLALVAAACGGQSDNEDTGRVKQASHPELSLPGSNFEIDTDANFRQDDPSPSIDWATPSINVVPKADIFDPKNDDAFGKGSKEDDENPSLVTGGIPPNKSDLKFFGVYQEGSTTTGFLNMFWTRVLEPSGTTNMDFEFNKLQCKPNASPTNCSSNGVTPKRSAGDFLITYDLDQGGTVPTISVRRWVVSGNPPTGAWGTPVDLTHANTVEAAGSINASAISATEFAAVGAQTARTLGEAQIALSAIFDPTKCESFGSVYLKSRSASSFSAEMKDFIAPQPVNISNCGRIVIDKTDGSKLLKGAKFTISPPTPAASMTEVADGVFCTDKLVLTGSFTVTETDPPPGYDLANPSSKSGLTPTAGDCTNVDGTTTANFTFVDSLKKGAILIQKNRKHSGLGTGDHPHAGVTFNLYNGATLVGTATTSSGGQVCFENLTQGTKYTVKETVPAKYLGEGDKKAGETVDKDVTPNQAGSCGSLDATTGTYKDAVANSVTFNNTPLSDIKVQFIPEVVDSNVPPDPKLQGTAAKISCTGLTDTGPDTTPNDFDDTTETFVGLKPGTYNCTIVIDP